MHGRMYSWTGAPGDLRPWSTGRRVRPSGPAATGVGKTHLAITFAVAAPRAGGGSTSGRSISRLLRGRPRHRPAQAAPQDADDPALWVDETPILSDPERGQADLPLVNARYGRASTVLTSNKGFEHWGEILPTRSWRPLRPLLHRCHFIRGNSWMRRHMELSTGHPPDGVQGGGRRESPGGGRVVCHFRCPEVCHFDAH